ncbi:MAG: hypothetical protein ACTHMS_10185 [Jatrophihabitans sp.]|uniref:hypothetical protein n=1 Tax=Jatrophihabitans sp. TaxID=1932789 RepID=UPI003F7E938C
MGPTAQPALVIGGPPDVGRPPRADRRTTALWFLLTLVAAGCAAVVPVLFYHRFYFVNDTESGAFGVWYKLGTELRAGHIQIFDPHVWQAGNYVAEGQWGFWNPLVLLIALIASVAGNAALFCTGLKIILSIVGAAGAFVLSRSFGADERWAAVAGLAVSVSGFTVYMDAASWVTGQMIWAFLPWFWVALRRYADRRANPAPALIMGYLCISVGYVYGAIGVIFVLIGTAVEVAVERRWRDLLRLVAVGVLCGLVTITVYLPGVLSSSVSTRYKMIGNDGTLAPSLSGLAVGPQPAARPFINGFWLYHPDAPILYIAWFLPLLAFLDWTAARHLLRRRIGGLVVLALYSLMLFAPSQMGAIRFPARNMSMFVMVLLPLLACLLSRARTAPSRRRFAVAVGLTVASGYLAWAQAPMVLDDVVISSVLMIIAFWVLRWMLPASPRPMPARGAALLLVTSLVFVVLQHHASPASPLLDYKLPAKVSAYRTIATGSVGDGIVVGNQTLLPADPGYWRDSALANTWYLTGHQYANAYTPVGFRAYANVTCMNYLGSTCPALLRRLFEVQPTTGMLLVDEMSINSVLIIKRDVPRRLRREVPDGWSLKEDTKYVQLWTRDDPVAAVGSPVDVSPGLTISDVRSSDRAVSFRVDAVRDGTGRVVFSRLAWPGYVATNASLGKPVDGFLLSLRIPPGATGRTVEVRFSPPGWRLGWVTWALAVGSGLIWSVVAGVDALRRRRRDRGTTEAEPSTVSA